jgi:hypothetical protein
MNATDPIRVTVRPQPGPLTARQLEAIAASHLTYLRSLVVEHARGYDRNARVLASDLGIRLE